MKAFFSSKRKRETEISDFHALPVFWPFLPPLLWLSSLRLHILEPRVFVSVCEDKCCLKGMLDNKFRGAIFHPLTRMKEPSSTKTEAVWTLMELHGQSSYVMYQGCFVSSKNGTLKLSSKFFFYSPHKGFARSLQTFIKGWVATLTFLHSL